MFGKKLNGDLLQDFNIFMMSVSFFFLFAAFFTMGNVQTVILDSAQDQNSTGYVEDFDGDGYVSLSILYGSSFVCDFFAPTIVGYLGHRMALVISSCAFTLYIGSFFVLNDALLYSASAILGLGNGVIWVAQGSFLSLNSNNGNIDRNSGIFYMFWTGSGVVGNTYSYFQFKDSDEIDDDTRLLFVSVLFTLSCLGTATMLLLRPPSNKNATEKRMDAHFDVKDNQQWTHSSKAYISNNNTKETMGNDTKSIKNTSLSKPELDFWINEKGDINIVTRANGKSSRNETKSPLSLLMDLFELMATLEMQLLLPYFIYVGTMFTFWTGILSSLSFPKIFYIFYVKGVYGPSLTFAEDSFEGDASSLAGLHGIMVNTAGMTVGLLMSLFGNYVKGVPRYVFVQISTLLHLISYSIIIMNVPGEAPKGETTDDALLIIPSSTALAMISSLLLGAGAGVAETQSIALLGSEYSHNPSPAFALMKMCHHASMGLSYLYAGYLSMYYQVAILATLAVTGSATFTIVDLKNRRRNNANLDKHVIETE